METKHIQALLPTSDAIKNITAYSEFAGTPEQEAKIGYNGAIKAITEFRRKRYVQNYMEKVNRKTEYKYYTTRSLFDYITQERYPEIFNGEKMVLDDYNRDIILYLCQYFTNDEKFPGSLEKGILLMGNVGTGKSRLMKLFGCNQKQSFAFRSCKEITDRFFRIDNKEQDEYIQNYYGKLPTDHPKFYGQTDLGYCFDDLGTDDEKKYFGNPTNVMNEIIQSRYNRFHDLKSMTHFTTNMNGDEIEKAYGTRTRSRLREMCNSIIFHGSAPDRRK